MYSLRSICLLASATLLSAPTLHAQIASELKGRVADPTGASIRGAQVTLIGQATGVRQQAITTAEGYYTFANLTSGVYSIDLDAPGFQRIHRTGITILTGQTTLVDLNAVVGSQQQVVEVNADAPLLQAETSDIKTTITGDAIVAIPLNSRNFIQLTTLAPGVELPPGTQLPRINGGRPRTNEYLFDGISALQPEPGQVVYFPIVDSIAEFTVEANNVSAEFGRFNGGVVNVATRSGSNVFHGSLFEFFRNEDLNARNFFATTGRKPEYRRNLYGATLGGPVLRNKLFFFADYQGIKQRIGKTVISTIPTNNERAGIFTGVANIYNPNATTTIGGVTTRQQFTNNVINVPFDPAAAALLKYLPPVSNGNAANNYTRTANDDDHQNQFDFRVDGAYRTRDRAFARYTYYNEVELPVTPFPLGGGAVTGSVIGTNNVAGLSNVLGQQAVFNETHTFSNSIVNDVRLGYTRRGNTITGPTLGNTASSALGIPGIPTNAAFNNALPLFTFTGFQQIGSTAGTFSAYQTGVWQLTDTVLWTKGKHALKAGMDLRWYQLNTVAPPNPTGSFAFTTTGSNQISATGTAVASTGNAFASFLLGQVDTFQIDLQTAKIRPRDAIQEFFVQDDWKLTPKLTVNLGARYTLANPSTEKTNQGAVFNTTTQQLDYLGVNGNSRSARELHWDNVAPRVGFTYLATPKTVVRSGFGIVFIDQSGITTPFTTPQFPFIQSVQQKTQDSVNATFKLSNGPTVAAIPLTPAAGLGQSVYTANRKAGSGYVQQWNLAVQREINNNLSFEVAYVGSHIVHVGIQDSNMNQLTTQQLAAAAANPTPYTTLVTNPYFGQLPASSSLNTKTIAAGELLKPFPRFLNVSAYRNNSGETNYNAIEARVEERLAHGVSFTFAYTHSKLIDDASSVFSSTVLSSPNTSSLVAADYYQPQLERDSSSGDMPNVIAGSVTYELPAGRGHKLFATGVTNAVLGGWAVNAIVTSQSGMPVTVTQATITTPSFSGIVTQRPNIVAKAALNPDARTPAKFFNTAAFATAPAFTIGTASRNPVRGPAFRDLDMALVKHTHFGELAQMEIRAEVFNVTNTPAFGQPNGSFGSAAFGSITTTVAEQRVAQLAIRLSR